MQGIYSVNGDMQIIDNDLLITKDIELLTCELFNFLNTRAAHIVNDVIIFEGECIEDQNLGLDHDLIFESDINKIKAYVSRQILRYFSDRIKEFINFDVSKDIKTRTLLIDFTAKTIYNENIKMGVKI